MEREIIRAIPLGSNIQQTKRIMWLNGFVFSKQTNTSLEFEKDDAWGLPLEGTCWLVKIGFKNGLVSDAKVWIQPND